MQDMDKILQESNVLELIVSFYERNGQAEKAAPHIKRIFDQRVEQKDWKELVNGLRKYRDYLTANEQRRYVNRFVEGTADTFSSHYEEAKEIVLGEFSELVDSSKFSSFFCNALHDKVCYSHSDLPGINDIYALVEKYKDRVDKEEFKPKLAKVLARLVARGEAEKKDVAKFEPYLDDRAKCFLVVNALISSKDSAKVLAEYQDYLRQIYAYEILRDMVRKETESRMFEQYISMGSIRDAVGLLKNRLRKEQVGELVNKIASAQFDYFKPGRVQRDPAGDIIEEEDPDYGLPYALDTVKQFPDDIEPGLAKKIMQKFLAKQFYEEANERYFRKTEGTAKETIKACKGFIDRETIECALADAFKEGLGLLILGRAEKVLKKFPKYVNREYIAEAVAEKLPDAPSYIIKNFGHYLSDEQLKEAVKESVRREALRDNFRDLPELVESAESRFTPEELSDFFLGLFEDVRDNVEVSSFKGKERGKKDAALEFLEKFSSYVPRNETTENYYQLLDIRRELPKDDD